MVRRNVDPIPVVGHAPWSFGFTPIAPKSEPGSYASTRYQRVRITVPSPAKGQPPVRAWVTVHEDGHLTVGSYSHGFRVEQAWHCSDGSTMQLVPFSLAGELPPELDDAPQA